MIRTGRVLSSEGDVERCLLDGTKVWKVGSVGGELDVATESNK